MCVLEALLPARFDGLGTDARVFSLVKVTPVGPRVVVKVAELEKKTLGGILLPDSSQKKPTSGKGAMGLGIHRGGVLRTPLPPPLPLVSTSRLTAVPCWLPLALSIG